MIRKSGNLDATDRFENRGDGIAFGESSLNWYGSCSGVGCPFKQYFFNSSRISQSSRSIRGRKQQKNPRKTNLGDC